MPRVFSFDEYKDILESYIHCDYNANAAQREYREKYRRERIPNRRVFQDTYQRYRETGQFYPRPGEIVPNVANVDAVLQLVEDEPTISTRRIAARTGVPQSSVNRYIQAEG